MEILYQMESICLLQWCSDFAVKSADNISFREQDPKWFEMLAGMWWICWHICHQFIYHRTWLFPSDHCDVPATIKPIYISWNKKSYFIFAWNLKFSLKCAALLLPPMNINDIQTANPATLARLDSMNNALCWWHTFVVRNVLPGK